ncbi:MAG: NADH-quinone oxidoreductase subunit M [Chitinophagales bacterium]|nr:NADH-quinone oxidoreductase subunit M [Chitinophagales bacterium]MDW8392807.1 NADH-quinone oxidoreductase subunit M [Chitinophagales bacterium]
MNLHLLILIPLLTAVTIALWGRGQRAALIATAGAVVQLGLSVLLYLTFTAYRQHHAGEAFVFEYRHVWYGPLQIAYHLGVDGISVAMVMLTAIVVLAGVLMSWEVSYMPREFHTLLTLLGAGAYGVFLSLDAFTLFFFLELAVLPKYLLIGIWGSGKKEYCARKLVLMLMLGSALVLVGLLGMYFGGPRSFSIPDIASSRLAPEVQQWVFPLLFTGFGIFTALFPFHTWVPDGHSAAPTAGSMFLAGISMKLGGYGCLRTATHLMPDAAQQYAPTIIVLGCIAILYGSLATLMQKDIKYLNAYSSISHCGFVVLGIGLLTQTALHGAVLQMVSHGLMTALFFAVIGIVYERTHTRQLREMGGLMQAMPFAVTALFLAGLCSLGLPGLSGFVAEATVFVGGWQQPDLLSRTAVVIACSSIVVTAVYILRAIGQVAMGPLRGLVSPHPVSWAERLAVLLLLGGIFLMGLWPEWLVQLIQGSGPAGALPDGLTAAPVEAF